MALLRRAGPPPGLIPLGLVALIIVVLLVWLIM